MRTIFVVMWSLWISLIFFWNDHGVYNNREQMFLHMEKMKSCAHSLESTSLPSTEEPKSKQKEVVTTLTELRSIAIKHER